LLLRASQESLAYTQVPVTNLVGTDDTRGRTQTITEIAQRVGNALTNFGEQIQSMSQQGLNRAVSVNMTQETKEDVVLQVFHAVAENLVQAFDDSICISHDACGFLIF
jgi:ABC-type hemin transport system substrate-binding protein